MIKSIVVGMKSRRKEAPKVLTISYFHILKLISHQITPKSLIPLLVLFLQEGQQRSQADNSQLMILLFLNMSRIHPFHKFEHNHTHHFPIQFHSHIHIRFLALRIGLDTNSQTNIQEDTALVRIISCMCVVASNRQLITFS